MLGHGRRSIAACRFFLSLKVIGFLNNAFAMMANGVLRFLFLVIFNIFKGYRVFTGDIETDVGESKSVVRRSPS